MKELDYGADLGGFIIKDHLWFFTAYDRVDNQRDRVPTEARSVLDSTSGRTTTTTSFPAS